MMKQLCNVRVKTLAATLACVWLCSQIVAYMYIDEFIFTKIPQKSVAHQKSCLSQFLDVFKKHKVALLFFDIEILPEVFQSRPKSWHDSGHECKTMCKFHPENKNVISFAIQAYQFNKHKESIRADLKVHGFAVHMTTSRDPVVFQSEGKTQFIPTYLWLAKADHVIHVAILYERHNSYVWLGPVTDRNWKNTVSVLSKELTGGWHSMERIGAKFPTYEQAFEKSQRFLSFPLNIDGHRISLPYHINDFLKEYRQSRFIECNYAQARKFRKNFPVESGVLYKKLRQKSKDSLSKVKKALDKLHVTFWLSGGTLLGWLRECDIIPYSKHIVLGVWNNTLKQNVLSKLEKESMFLLHRLGHENDSYHLSFSCKEGIPVEMYSFYVEDNLMWYGGTQADNGRKYKFYFEKFQLCWTEYLEIKVRVPCQAEMYVEASIGKDWMLPREQWIWNLDPPNVHTNGQWPDEEWEKVIQMQEKDKNKLKGEEDEEIDEMIADAVDLEPHSSEESVEKNIDRPQVGSDSGTKISEEIVKNPKGDLSEKLDKDENPEPKVAKQNLNHVVENMRKQRKDHSNAINTNQKREQNDIKKTNLKQAEDVHEKVDSYLTNKIDKKIDKILSEAVNEQNQN